MGQGSPRLGGPGGGHPTSPHLLEARSQGPLAFKAQMSSQTPPHPQTNFIEKPPFGRGQSQVGGEGRRQAPHKDASRATPLLTLPRGAWPRTFPKGDVGGGCRQTSSYPQTCHRKATPAPSAAQPWPVSNDYGTPAHPLAQHRPPFWVTGLLHCTTQRGEFF